jgi:hypothetical protein
MAKDNEMFCRLKWTHVTEDGDYIPQGTPVRVLYWSPDTDSGLLRVEATAYMYCECDDNDDFRSFIGTGMLIDVKPNALTFSSFHKGE